MGFIQPGHSFPLTPRSKRFFRQLEDRVSQPAPRFPKKKKTPKNTAVPYTQWGAQLAVAQRGRGLVPLAQARSPQSMCRPLVNLTPCMAAAVMSWWMRAFSLNMQPGSTNKPLILRFMAGSVKNWLLLNKNLFHLVSALNWQPASSPDLFCFVFRW